MSKISDNKNKYSTDSFILEEYNEIMNIEFYEKILNSISQMTIIINENNEIVFSNKKFMDFLEIDNIQAVLGKRPGESFHCEKICNTNNRCGSTEACKFCGTYQAIVLAQNTGKSSMRECRLVSNKNHKPDYFDFQVEAAPIVISSHKFTLISFTDISNEKRKEALERIFFHDIINTVNGLSGYIQLLSRNADENTLPIAEALTEINQNLIEAIHSQRDLLAAERGDLIISRSILSSFDLMDYCILHLQEMEEANNIKIIKKQSSVNVSFSSDEILVKRILINLLKNAIEAGSDDNIIYIESQERNGYIHFSVSNNKVIPLEIQYQIFQRNFSTKGKNRGLGSYSVKLLTEEYLSGEIFFISNLEKGTVFTIKLPLS